MRPGGFGEAVVVSVRGVVARGDGGTVVSAAVSDAGTDLAESLRDDRSVQVVPRGDALIVVMKVVAGSRCSTDQQVFGGLVARHFWHVE